MPLLTDSVIRDWCGKNDVALTVSKLSDLVTVTQVPGDIPVHVLDEQIALIDGALTNAPSSKTLRQLQKDFRSANLSLYLVYPWETESTRLLSHFNSKLGNDSRKFSARRLEVRSLDNKVANEFLKKHHIQGVASGASKVSYGLFTKDTDELLAVQQYSKYRFAGRKGANIQNDSKIWEGLRLCFLPGVQIYGGASRLQNQFERDHEPSKIISYVNRSHSDGDYKNHQGFRDVSDDDIESFMWVLSTSPRKVVIKDKDGVLRVNDPALSLARPFINPSSMAGSFGRGVGQTFYGGKLGSRKQLREHSANGSLVHNDAILEAIGYRKMHTAGQYKWVKEFPKT